MTQFNIEIGLCDVGHCGLDKTHDYLTEFWEIKIPKPEYEIIPPCHEDNSVFGYNPDTQKINIALLHLNKLYQVNKQVGWNLDPINFLKYYFAEQQTVYIAHTLNPENFERLNDLGLVDRDYKKFINAMTIRAELAGISRIGSRHVAKKLGFYDENCERKLIEEVFDRINLSTEKLQKEAEPIPENDKKSITQIILKFMGLITSGVSAIGHYLSYEMEEEWEGRYDQLIKRKLEPDEKYISKVEVLIKEKFPIIHEFIKNNLPH